MCHIDLILCSRIVVAVDTYLYSVLGKVFQWLLQPTAAVPQQADAFWPLLVLYVVPCKRPVCLTAVVTINE